MYVPTLAGNLLEISASAGVQDSGMHVRDIAHSNAAGRFLENENTLVSGQSKMVALKIDLNTGELVADRESTIQTGTDEEYGILLFNLHEYSGRDADTEAERWRIMYADIESGGSSSEESNRRYFVKRNSVYGLGKSENEFWT